LQYPPQVGGLHLDRFWNRYHLEWEGECPREP
jgi:hypothetical protein